MARPRHRLIPLSRDLAENLVVAVEGDGRPVDAKAVRALLVLLSRAATVATETDDEILDHEDTRRGYDPGERLYDPLYVGLRALRDDLGRVRPAVVKAAMPAMAALRVGLRGEPGYGLVSPVMAFMSDPGGRRIHEGTPVGVAKVERTLVAAATGSVHAVWVDTRALRHLRCRYSAILLLRVLAALEVPPKGARPGRNGKLWFEIPAGEAQAWLGVVGIPKRANVTQNVIEPAVRELAEVGVDLSLRWRENYRGEPVALRVGVASSAEARHRAAVDISRRRAALLAARRKARRARRVEAIRQAGGPSALARLRYHPRRRRPDLQET